MAFEAFEKSPDVAPLLVRLYDTHNLYSLAGEKDSDDSRGELTTIITDLLQIKLTNREQELITDVLLALMKQAQTDLRQALAERLSAMDNVPLRIILSLADDEIQVAQSVLMNSPILQDLDLAYILRSKGNTYGRAMAKRKVLSEAMINMLADTKDFATAVNLCENDGIRLTHYAMKICADMARESDSIALPLLARPEVPAQIASALYTIVGDDLKAKIEARFGDALHETAKSAVDAVVQELAQKPKASPEHLISSARYLLERGELKVTNMVSVLRRGQNATFLAYLAVFMNVPVTTAKDMVCEKTGQAFAMACKARDLSKGDFVSLFLLTDKFRSPDRKIVNHLELSRIMMMFDDIDVATAKAHLNKLMH